MPEFNKRSECGLNQRTPDWETCVLYARPQCLDEKGRKIGHFIAFASLLGHIFILEGCLLLVYKRLTIQTTNAIKDVANEGHRSPRVMGILAQTLHTNATPLIQISVVLLLIIIKWVSSHTPSPPLWAILKRWHLKVDRLSEFLQCWIQIWCGCQLIF